MADDFVEMTFTQLTANITRNAEKLAKILIEMGQEEVDRAIGLTACDVSTEEGRIKFTEQKAYIQALRAGRAMLLAGLTDEENDNESDPS